MQICSFSVVTFLLGYEKHPRVLAARPFCFELGPPRWKITRRHVPVAFFSRISEAEREKWKIGHRWVNVALAICDTILRNSQVAVDECLTQTSFATSTLSPLLSNLVKRVTNGGILERIVTDLNFFLARNPQHAQGRFFFSLDLALSFSFSRAPWPHILSQHTYRGGREFPLPPEKRSFSSNDDDLHIRRYVTIILASTEKATQAP